MHLNPKEWQVFFGVSIYELGRDKNKLVFDSMTNLNHANQDFIYVVSNQVKFILQHYRVNGLCSIQLERRLIEVTWSPPQSGCYKVNIDGSHITGGGSAYGGLIKHGEGSFVHGFFCKLGSSNALWAELWGLRLGIKLASQLNLNWIVFELDSKVYVDMVNSCGSFNALLQLLMQEILLLLQRPCWRMAAIHTYWEANRCVNFLARQGHMALSFDWVLVDAMSPSLGLLLADDIRGTCLPRMIS